MDNWHSRYAQQARWTRALRAYTFDKIKLDDAHRVLEVGCGTGAILSDLPTHLSLHGLDINPAALAQCRAHVLSASLIRGDALQLPYTNSSFDVVYCHFLLLWVKDPIQALYEMKRVARIHIDPVEPGTLLQLAKQEFVSKHRIILFRGGMRDKGGVDSTPLHFVEKILRFIGRFDILLGALARQKDRTVITFDKTDCAKLHCKYREP